jgi:hypothetical protein
VEILTGLGEGVVRIMVDGKCMKGMSNVDEYYFEDNDLVAVWMDFQRDDTQMCWINLSDFKEEPKEGWEYYLKALDADMKRKVLNQKKKFDCYINDEFKCTIDAFDDYEAINIIYRQYRALMVEGTDLKAIERVS